MNERPAPDLRGAMREDEAAFYLMDHPDSDEEIPTLDISPYLSGHPGGRERVAAKLREITTTVGFFYLRGHAIPQDMIDSVFAQARRFFSLSDSEKRRIPYVATDSLKSGYQNSFTDGGKRANINIISDARPNLLEKFSVNREGRSGAAINIWPENLPGFREGVE